MEVLLGQTKTGKTTTIMELLSKRDNKHIIFDFNNQYEGYSPHVLSLDEIDPSLSPLGIKEMKALNAGFLEYSHLLYQKSEDVLWDHARNEGRSSIDGLKAKRLMEDTVERLQNSWEPNVIDKGNKLKPRIQFRKSKEQYTLEEVVDYVKKHDKIVFRTRSLHSEQVRALTYVLLSVISDEVDGRITVVSDNLTTLFNQANVKLLIETLQMDKFDFVLSFNRFANLAPCLEPYVKEYRIFRFDTNANIKELEQLYFGDLSGDPREGKEIVKFKKKIKVLKNGEHFRKSIHTQRKELVKR